MPPGRMSPLPSISLSPPPEPRGFLLHMYRSTQFSSVQFSPSRHDTILCKPSMSLPNVASAVGECRVCFCSSSFVDPVLLFCEDGIACRVSRFASLCFFLLLFFLDFLFWGALGGCPQTRLALRREACLGLYLPR